MKSIGSAMLVIQEVEVFKCLALLKRRLEKAYKGRMPSLLSGGNKRLRREASD